MLRPMIQIDHLGKSYGFRTILQDINFIVREGEKVALVGPNGVGKTTILRIIAGIEVPTVGGVRFFQDDVSMKYIPQDPEFDWNETPNEVLSAAENSLASAAQGSAPEAMSRFGFTPAEAHLPIAQLSGGQKTRLALALAWMSRPEFLLLDEPTNHLDQGGLRWLEGFIQDFPGTVLIVSHDRYFLDQVADRIIELSSASVREYKGNYTAYKEAKEKAFLEQMAQYESEQKRIRKLEDAIARQMQWFEKSHRDAGTQTENRMGIKEFYRARAKRMARRAKSNIKRLESMKESSVEKPQAEKTIGLSSFEAKGGGRRLILAEDLGKSFDKPLFSSANFGVFRGDKIGIIGQNGSGKTTLIRMVLGQEVPSSGFLWISPGISIGYLDQELATLDPEASVLGEVLKVFPRETAEHVTRARTFLGSFLFSPDDIDKRVSVLSTGERKRVALVKLLLSQFRVLILDEPTDHLDLPSREKLEEALEAYGGTLILVSHDRYMLSRVCNRILSIEGNQIRTYDGGYDEYTRGTSKPAQAGGAGSKTVKLSKDERLLLETRMARLNSELSLMSRKDPRFEASEEEFFTIARRLQA